jgi:integrase/recombinase XerC
MQHWPEAYLTHVRVTKRLSERTVDLYAHSLAQLTQRCETDGVPILEVQRGHIRSWLVKRHSQGTAPSTLATELSGWRGFYQWLVMQGHTQHNPCTDVRAPKAAKPLPKALGVDAAMAMANFVPAVQEESPLAPSTLGQLVVELLYGCGLRVSELVGLDTAASAYAMQSGHGWIDAAACEVHVLGKGNKRRTVPLGSKAHRALTQYLPARAAQLASLGQADDAEAALLLSPKGRRLTRQAVWGLLRARSRAAGLETPVHPHMLRHSFASHVLQSSGDLRAVQELLGHSSIASTQVYTRLDFQHLASIYDSTHPRAKLLDTTQRTTT